MHGDTGYAGKPGAPEHAPVNAQRSVPDIYEAFSQGQSTARPVGGIFAPPYPINAPCQTTNHNKSLKEAVEWSCGSSNISLWSQVEKI